MKAPIPVPPAGAPPGVVWFGGAIEWRRISLRVMGPEVDPQEITHLLGHEPQRASRKGDLYNPKKLEGARRHKGIWSVQMKREETDEWDVGEAMVDLVKSIPVDKHVWRKLAERFSIDLFVWLSMPSTNKGLVLSPAVMIYLGERGIEAGFDIYYASDKSEKATQIPSTDRIGH